MQAKKWYLSKTVRANTFVGVVTLLIALGGFLSGPDFPLELSPEVAYLIGFAIAILNVVLRFVTKQPIE